MITEEESLIKKDYLYCKPVNRLFMFWLTQVKVKLFVLGNLDYCNSLFYGITDGLPRLGACNRSKRRYSYTVPTRSNTHSLTWLPPRLKTGINYKLALLLFRQRYSPLPPHRQTITATVSTISHPTLWTVHVSTTVPCRTQIITQETDPTDVQLFFSKSPEQYADIDAIICWYR